MRQTVRYTETLSEIPVPHSLGHVSVVIAADYEDGALVRVWARLERNAEDEQDDYFVNHHDPVELWSSEHEEFHDCKPLIGAEKENRT